MQLFTYIDEELLLHLQFSGFQIFISIKFCTECMLKGHTQGGRF